MQGIWITRCPRCSSYIKKADPLELYNCCACGWEETAPVFYCDVIHNYCSASLK